MKFTTLSTGKDQLETLRKLSKAIGLSQSLSIRMAIDELIEDKEKLKKKLFPQKGK